MATGFQINLWIPDPPPARDLDREREVRELVRRRPHPIRCSEG